jgi:hypothetical protein
LITPGEDPVGLAAWVEYRVNLTDHFFADGCGKISKAVSGWVLMRYAQDLPTYKGSIPKDRYPTKVRGSSDAMDAQQLGNWEEFYRGMFKGAAVQDKNAKAPQTVADEYRALPDPRVGGDLVAGSRRVNAGADHDRRDRRGDRPRRRRALGAQAHWRHRRSAVRRISCKEPGPTAPNIILSAMCEAQSDDCRLTVSDDDFRTAEGSIKDDADKAQDVKNGPAAPKF